MSSKSPSKLKSKFFLFFKNLNILLKLKNVYLFIYFSKEIEKKILVMEHLFADREISNKFDLKGSERNRLVDPNSQTGGECVLLDENLMQSK